MEIRTSNFIFQDNKLVKIGFFKIKTPDIEHDSFLEVRPDGTVIWHQHNAGDYRLNIKDNWKKFEVVSKGVIVC